MCKQKSYAASDRDNTVLIRRAIDLSEYEKEMHEFFMQKALNLLDPHPQGLFAAIIVDYSTKQILAKGIDLDDDPTLHGELSAIQNYYSKYGNEGWSNLVLYSTAEPCAMCMSAIIWAGQRVVWATTLATQISAGVGRIQVPVSYIVDNAKGKYNPLDLISGVLAEKTDPIFFSERNFRIKQIINDEI